VQGIAELDGPLEHIGLEQGGIGRIQPLFQGLAPDKLHYQAGAPVLLEIVRDLGDVDMVQTAQQLGFLLKETARGGPLGLVFRLRTQFLERPQDAAAGGQFFYLIYPGHTATAHQADNAVSAVQYSTYG
jgi:hypothetical protein